jgi:hypothetical protein
MSDPNDGHYVNKPQVPGHQFSVRYKRFTAIRRGQGQEGTTVLHCIEWLEDGEFDLLPGGDKRGRLERVHIYAGEVLEGVVRCHVTDDLVEVADIALVDDTGVLLDVPCASFQFLDMKW